MVLYPVVSLVSINPEGSLDHTARDARALAVPIVNPIRWQLIENRAMLLLDV